jgi:electron transfer flavoprotein alpha subunit
MLNLTRSLLRRTTPTFNFSTLLIPSPNGPGSDLGQLLSASSNLPSPVDVLQICTSDRSDQILSEIASTIPADSINSLYLKGVEDMPDNSYFGCMDLIKEFVKENKSKYTHVIMGNSNLSKELLPRLACAFDSQAISDVVAVLDNHRFQRPIYAGNAISTVRAILSDPTGRDVLMIFKDKKLIFRSFVPWNSKHKFPKT